MESPIAPAAVSFVVVSVDLQHVPELSCLSGVSAQGPQRTYLYFGSRSLSETAYQYITCLYLEDSAHNDPGSSIPRQESGGPASFQCPP